MSKILFVYPNISGYPIIPTGISVLSGILKHHKHECDLFDITFMVPENEDHVSREKAGTVEKTSGETHIWKRTEKDILKCFNEKIISFEPDLIAFSIVENMYGFAREMMFFVKNNYAIPIIVGGPFPTVASELFIKDQCADYICIGEGENALLELANNISSAEDCSDIKNLIVKLENGHMKQNPPGKFYEWNDLIMPDWEMFNEQHLNKPFMGNWYKTGFFEMSRGCLSKCTYCSNYSFQKIFKELGKYHREKPIDFLIAEIIYFKKLYNLELIFFNDENFMMMSNPRFKMFCDKYKKMVNLPFYIQTRADTLLNENKVKMLKAVGCITIGIGIETGNEQTRNNILNKKITDNDYIKAFSNCNKYGIRTTANVMIGLPFENENDVFLTAAFCKKLKATSVSVAIFAPYYGTKLREVCIKNRYIEDKYNSAISMRNTSILTMPQISKEQIEKIYLSFTDMVFNT